MAARLALWMISGAERPMVDTADEAPPVDTIQVEIDGTVVIQIAVIRKLMITVPKRNNFV